MADALDAYPPYATSVPSVGRIGPTFRSVKRIRHSRRWNHHTAIEAT